MGETTGAAGAQDERDGFPAKEAGQTGNVIRVCGANVTNEINGQERTPVLESSLPI
jgi:hypothetical protein